MRERWPEIAQVADTGVQLHPEGAICQAQPWAAPQLDSHSDGRYAVLARRWDCTSSPHALSLHYRVFEHSDPTHRGIVQLRANTSDTGLTTVLVPGAPAQHFALDGSSSSAPPSLAGFIREGAHHILIGTDHILFLLALLLPAVLVRRADGAWQAAPTLKPVALDVLRIVTAFTVAHSITLALAAFEVLNPPSRWIESLIAASVILAALNNLWPVLRGGRWVMTFAFGLVHGFGFAGALKDLGLTQGALAWPLLGFNLGVELGQLAVVALFFATVWALRGRALYQTGVLRGGSAAISVLALGWLVERALDLKLPLPL